MEVWKIILIVWFVVAAVFVALGLFFRSRTWVGFGGMETGGHRHHHRAGGDVGGGAAFAGGADFGGGGGADFGGGGGADCGGGGGGAHGYFPFYFTFKFYYPNPIIKPNPVQEDGNVENHRLSLACCCILCLPFALWTLS
ncbi:hypothetical protein PRUPE_6G262600 [Prunus persica]|uniref:Uncharacterized protein n=1 Tax=Prunus persica TaxID=3760 RepID=M5W4V3_PRUPE|nr:hypothetical protein PRUPE_6G262600 [Prunus persica]